MNNHFISKIYNVLITNKLVLLFCAITFLTSLILQVSTVPLSPTDETDHYRNVQSYANNHWPKLRSYKDKDSNSPDLNQISIVYDNNIKIPFSKTSKETPVVKTANLSDESKDSNQATHPPIYYLAAAAVYKFVSLFGFRGLERYYFVRLTSLLLYFITLLFIFKTLRLFFLKKSSAIMTLSLSLHPMLLSIATTVNPEIAAVSFSTVFFFLLFRSIKFKTFQTRFIIQLGVISGVAILSKVSNLVLIPISYVAILIDGSYKIKKTIVSYTKYLFTTVLILFPWLLINFIIYKTPLLHNYGMNKAYAIHFSQIPSLAYQSFLEFINAIVSLASFFEPPIISIPLEFRYFHFIFMLSISIFGFFYLRRQKIILEKKLLRLITFSIFSGLAFFLVLACYVQFIYRINGVGPRYFLILTSPMVLLFTYGLYYLSKKNFENLTLSVYFLSLIYIIASFVIVFGTQINFMVH